MRRLARSRARGGAPIEKNEDREETMKTKNTLGQLVRAAGVALLGTLASGAHAQKAGDNVVTLGWFHIMPQDSSTPMTTYVSPQPIDTPLRLPSAFTSQGTGLSTNNADTLGLVFSHFLTDHIALTTVAGVPPTFKIRGRGSIVPPGPAGALGTENLDDPANEPIVKSVRQWSPAMMVQYENRGGMSTPD